MDVNMEKLMYLLDRMEFDIGALIDNVLSDSEDDPHYSAVAATNRIKCYISVMKDLGEELPYNTVEEFFKVNAYTDSEYERFESKRKKESVYYRDVQY